MGFRFKCECLIEKLIVDIQGNRRCCTAEESGNGQSETGVQVGSSSAVNHERICSHGAVSASSTLDNGRCQLLDTSGLLYLLNKIFMALKTRRVY